MIISIIRRIVVTIDVTCPIIINILPTRNDDFDIFDFVRVLNWC